MNEVDAFTDTPPINVTNNRITIDHFQQKISLHVYLKSHSECHVYISFRSNQYHFERKQNRTKNK